MGRQNAKLIFKKQPGGAVNSSTRGLSQDQIHSGSAFPRYVDWGVTAENMKEDPVRGQPRLSNEFKTSLTKYQDYLKISKKVFFFKRRIRIQGVLPAVFFFLFLGGGGQDLTM